MPGYPTRPACRQAFGITVAKVHQCLKQKLTPWGPSLTHAGPLSEYILTWSGCPDLR